MATLLVNPMPPFDPDGANVAHKWKTWLADFKMYLIASNITDKKRQRALLLYQAGRVREIFRQLHDTGEDDAFDTAVTKLTSHFEPQKNRLFEVYTFRKAVQAPSETLDQFQTRGVFVRGFFVLIPLRAANSTTWNLKSKSKL